MDSDLVTVGYIPLEEIQKKIKVITYKVIVSVSSEVVYKIYWVLESPSRKKYCRIGQAQIKADRKASDINVSEVIVYLRTQRRVEVVKCVVEREKKKKQRHAAKKKDHETTVSPIS